MKDVHELKITNLKDFKRGSIIVIGEGEFKGEYKVLKTYPNNTMKIRKSGVIGWFKFWGIELYKAYKWIKGYR